MKKFINHPEDVVEEMLEGLVELQPGSTRLADHKVVLRSDAAQIRDRQVAVLSGGGSGHEPAHAGYIGAGMLSAAVLGEVFTSPSSDSVLAAILAASAAPGALLVVKNYTGDRLNFGLAAEMARAHSIPVEMVIVDDDVALKDRDQATGARGLAGTVFIHKLAGAAAAEGKTLTEVAAAARAAIAALATMGVSFSAGTSPAVGKPSFLLADDEMELGLGIHGEPGVLRTKLQSADELTDTLLDQILKHANFGDQKRVAIMVNNLGSTTSMEIAIVARHALRSLERRGFTVERLYAGTFLSSLDMAGLSLSVLGVDDERLRWLDAPTTAPAWGNQPKQRPGRPDAGLASTTPPPPVVASGTQPQTALRRAIAAACRSMIAAEADLTELDRITGDGDLGASMERASRAVLAVLDSYPLDNTSATLEAVGHTLRRELGGSSGPLYGVLFLRSSAVLKSSGASGLAQWAEAVAQGCTAIGELGGAKPGDRTMLDALIPFATTLRKHAGSGTANEVLLAAVEAAERGAEDTAQMKPRLGRSSYLGDRVLGHPDPGARAVALWLRAIANALIPS